MCEVKLSQPAWKTISCQTPDLPARLVFQASFSAESSSAANSSVMLVPVSQTIIRTSERLVIFFPQGHIEGILEEAQVLFKSCHFLVLLCCSIISKKKKKKSEALGGGRNHPNYRTETPN